MTPVSVVIAAHDEEAVLGRTLDRLLEGAAPGEVEVVVAANGCTDRTVQVAAARRGVRVLDLPEPGKTAALNAADRVATGWPRLYLDADIAVPISTVRTLCEALAGPHAPLVAVPARRLEVRGRPLAVRCYTAVHRHHPAFTDGLFGRGLIALSEAGRARFDRFPDVVADDLFLDSLFTREERVQVRSVTTVVQTPLRTRDLTRRLTRVRRGNAELRARGDARPAARGAWLRSVLLPRPWLAPAAVVYVALTARAAHAARRDPGADRWGRDDSTRTAVAG